MASTSVHIPDELLARIDAAAELQGISRNRVVVESCRRFLDERRPWPEGFFSNEHLTTGELEELRASAEAWSRLVGARRSGERSPW